LATHCAHRQRDYVHDTDAPPFAGPGPHPLALIDLADSSSDPINSGNLLLIAWGGIVDLCSRYSNRDDLLDPLISVMERINENQPAHEPGPTGLSRRGNPRKLGE
jgi:hypothetical protein